jgi:methyl-accepting chemotaxis protein
MNESIKTIIEQELLKEATYKQFKSEVKHRTKAEQLHKAMREVKKKINEIDRIVDYTQRMKQELSEGDGVAYWGRTEKAVAQIAEMVNHLTNKINNLKQ